MSPGERRSGPASHRGTASNAVVTDSQSMSRRTDTSRQPRRWKVVIEGRHCAFVSGWGTREELTAMRGRPPLWSSLSRAWCTTEDTARDLIARAERRGIQVDVESYVVVRREAPIERATAQREPELW